MAKNLISGPIFARLAQMWGFHFFFLGFTRTRCQTLLQAIIVLNFKESLWSKHKKMVKNLSFGLIYVRRIVISLFFCKTSNYTLFQKTFSWFLSLLDVRHCRKLSLYAFSRKTYDSNSIKRQETLFWAWLSAVGPKFGLPTSFSKYWLWQLLDIMVSYYHIQYQKKLMIQSWENLVTDSYSDKRTNRRTSVIS